MLHVSDPIRDEQPRPPARRWDYAVIPAAVTCLLAAIGLGRPSLWTDELATWGMATTPWSEFWSVLRYVDAVLAPYYAFMHAWVDVFGDSDVALRVPSLLAMSAAAGLVGAIGNRLAGRSAGLVAGLVFALLASTSRFAAEARPYAFAVALVCLATWLLVLAWEQSTVVRWVAYGLVVALVGWLHLIGLLLVAAHGWSVLMWRKSQWRRFALAAGGGVAATLVILIPGLDQRHQVAYIPPVGTDTFGQYSDVLFGGVVVGILLIVLTLFSLPLRYPSAVFTAWAVIPTVALLAVSVVLPMFLPRYLIYTTPGWALAAGVALARLRPAWVVSAVVALACLVLPPQLQMRGAGGHNQDNRALAAIVGSGVQAGDGIMYADDESGGSWTARDAIAHYLPAPYRPRDVLALRPQRSAGQLLAAECADISACLVDSPRLWVVRLGDEADPLAGLGASKEDFLRNKYTVDQVWHPAGMTVVLLERRGSAS